jgi:hypothetical protein
MEFDDSLASPPNGFLHYNDSELLWSSKGLATGIIVTPTFVFCGKGKGSWEKKGRRFVGNERKEIFFKGTEQRWYYVGTYEALDYKEIWFDKLQDLGSSVCYHHVTLSTILICLLSGNKLLSQKGYPLPRLDPTSPGSDDRGVVYQWWHTVGMRCG